MVYRTIFIYFYNFILGQVECITIIILLLRSQVSKNTGTVTIAHFARILAFLNIFVSADDFHLLVKRYLKDSYTLNYVGFLAAIDEIVQHMDRYGILDLGGVSIRLFHSQSSDVGSTYYFENSTTTFLGLNIFCFWLFTVKYWFQIMLE